jgi:DNA-binding MarR family transcriptional regulator
MTRPTHDQTATDAGTIGAGQPARTTLPNRAAARGLRALELLVFHPTSAPGLAMAMGLDYRTARRLLFALEDEGYLRRGQGAGRRRYLYSPTPKLLALAAQLAARLPLRRAWTPAWSSPATATLSSWPVAVTRRRPPGHSCRPPIPPAGRSSWPTATHGATTNAPTTTDGKGRDSKHSPPKSDGRATPSMTTLTPDPSRCPCP